MNLLFWYRSLMRSVGTALVKLIATATSGLVSFTTNVIRPVKVVCEFSPVQEGTGDPSPDNVRPISGWTGCNVFFSGVNIFNEHLRLGILNSDGTVTSGGNRLSSEYIPIKELTKYSYSFNAPSSVPGSRPRAAYYDKDKNLIRYMADFGYPPKIVNNRVISNFTTDANTAYVRFCLYSNYGTSYKNDIIINIFDESINGTYYPYYGNTILIDFESTAGTVYGGTVTLNEDGSADLVSSMAKFSLGDCNTYQQPSIGTSYSCQIFKAKVRSIGNTNDTTTGAVSDQLTEIRGYFYSRYPDRVETEFGKPCFAFQVANHGVYSDYFNVYIADTQYTTAADFKEAVKNVEICVLLPESARTVYHFDNIGQLQSFLGNNTVWHDMNGSITAEYYKKQ